MQYKRLIIGFSFLLTGFIISERTFSQDNNHNELIVHFIDVGQGDATLLEGTDFTILIDTGRHNRNEVVPYLKSQNISSIDLLIGTHPHADHTGQFPQVLESFPVNEVWMSGDLHTSLTFERALDAILATNTFYREPRAGQVYNFGSAFIEVLHPVEVNGDINNGSIAIKVTYGEIIFLFTGDAERRAEQEIVGRSQDLRSHILKIGHHGSRSSSTRPFLNAINPEVAIYSAAQGNSYGHPHQEVIDRFNRMGVNVYGTDRNGNILIVTDGTGYEIQVQRNQTVRSSQSFEVTTTGCVDLNTASRSELMRIIHIGESRADELIRLRPFRLVSQLTRINGIATGRLRDVQQQQLACVN